MTTTFGTEFECYLPAGTTRAALAAAIAARLGNPDACRADPYGHSATPYWKVVTDGSLNGNHGCEVVSRSMPPLSGEEGIAEMRKVCEALNDFGCTVDRAAGMHVHVKD